MTKMRLKMVKMRPKMAKMKLKMAKMRPKITKISLKMAKMRLKMTKMRPKMAKDPTGTHPSEEDAKKYKNNFNKKSASYFSGTRGISVKLFGGACVNLCMRFGAF